MTSNRATRQPKTAAATADRAAPPASPIDPTAAVTPHAWRRRWRPTVVAALLAASVLSLSGCHRQYYRRQADLEAHSLIYEKYQDACQIPGQPIHVGADPHSRMFNPFNLDFQPMPIDDPASNRYMKVVDGRRAYPLWEAAGKTNAMENPEWWQYLPLDENGILRLDAHTAVQLALLHSPDYQRQVEQLYLSALDVSSERFRFDTQFFGGASTFFTADGPDRRGASGSSSQLSLQPYSLGQRGLAMQRTFATGADLLVGFANGVVWDFSGPDTQTANTVFDFVLLQPLLRGAGRQRVLERLTLAERRLLANVRSFERYRRSFYLNITIGRNIESQVQRSGGVFGVGLGGFTGLGGGFSGLNSGGGGSGFGVSGGVPQAGGFIGLLQDQLQIRNLEENLARLNENLLILDDTLIEMLTTIPTDAEAIPRQRLQIAQAQSALLNSQSQLVSRKADYQNTLDSFLRSLGLPPYLCVVIDDPMLERFELIDQQLRDRREQLIQLRRSVGQINLSLLDASERGIDPATGLPQITINWSPQLAQRIAQLRTALAPLVQFRDQLLQEDLPRVRGDLDTLAQAEDKRRQQAQRLRAAYEENQDSICTLLDFSNISQDIFSGEEVSTIVTDLNDDYEKLSARLDRYRQLIDSLTAQLDRLSQPQPPVGMTDQEFADVVRNNVILASQDLLTDLADEVLSLQLIQARSRTESVVLPEILLTPAQAFEVARHNRRDWANARAALVDTWRLIEFNADDLESSLDIVFSGDVQNYGNNPLDLRTSTGRMRVGLRWDAPITRLQERNTYRQSLIEYEQARRNYYQFEDGIWQLVRGQLRQVLANQINFELGRQSVRIAAQQLELNEDIRALRDSRGLSSGPTAARDTISALSDLLNSQNTLLNLFVNYEVVRRSIDFDLETMQLTPEGHWIDPGTISLETLGGGDWMHASGVQGCGDAPCQISPTSLNSAMIEDDGY